jgi:hypothetical protein
MVGNARIHCCQHSVYLQQMLEDHSALTLSIRRPFKFKIPSAGQFKNLMEIAE